MSAMEFHPLADLFPMLEAGNADDLAAGVSVCVFLAGKL
jgi:hypothetical protein